MLQSDVLTAPSASSQSADAGHATPIDVSGTISAVEMSRLSGVGRERLRTWERRHKFPLPVRTPNGMRRYRSSDVRRVLAVARLVEQGMPLTDAVASLDTLADEQPSTASLGVGLDDAPSPAIAVTGPAPLTVAWANSATIKSPEAIQVGEGLLDTVPQFGARAISQLQQLIAGSDEALVIEHLDWIGTFPTTRRSLAWRLPAAAQSEPMVVLMQLGDEPTATADRSEVSRQHTWATAMRDAGSVLREQSGLASVQRAVAQLVRDTGALDGFIGTCRGQELRTASSIRGVFMPRSIPGATLGSGATAIVEGRVEWLDAGARDSLKAPTRSRVLLVPMQAGGHTVGALFVAYPEQIELCELTEELLRGFATTLATTLQREHLAQRSGAAFGPAH